MDIEQRIFTSNKDFRDFLDLNEIVYEESDHCDYLILEIRESNPKWPMVKEYMTIHKILSLATPIFTKAELESAPWLTVRSKWRWEYPMRADDRSYQKVVYNTDNHCPKCGVGLVQKDLFRLRKSPNWGTKHFLMLNWVEDELFISEKAKNLLSESSLEGFEFLDVLKYKKDIKDYIYLPATVRLEFGKHCRASFAAMEKRVKNASKETTERIDKARESILSSCINLEKLKFSDADELKEGLTAILDRLTEYAVDFFDERKSLDLISHYWGKNDKVAELVKVIADDERVMREPSQEEIFVWCEEGEKRYKKETPPG